MSVAKKSASERLQPQAEADHARERRKRDYGVWMWLCNRAAPAERKIEGFYNLEDFVGPEVFQKLEVIFREQCFDVVLDVYPWDGFAPEPLYPIHKRLLEALDSLPDADA